jgi:HlyD family secretion protein
VRVKLGKWIVAGGFVAIAATAGWLYFGRSDSSDTFTTSAVKRGAVSSSVAATGTANPVITVTVGSQISGQVQSLYADFNSTVRKGQVVAKLDPSNMEAQLARDRAQLASANAALERARVAVDNKKLSFERAKRLQAQDLIPESDFDAAQADYASAQADIKTAQASIAQAQASLRISQVNLDHATIVSPVDGTVISRNVDVGQTVAASLQAPTLFTIAQDLRRMEVHMNVAESDIGKLAVGQAATFTVDAYPQDRFQGSISEIRNSPTTIQNVVTYEAVIGVDNSELKLKPGMTANVSVVVARKDEALLVPNAALRFKPPEGLAAAAGASGASGSSGASSASAQGASPQQARAADAAPPAGAQGAGIAASGAGPAVGESGATRSSEAESTRSGNGGGARGEGSGQGRRGDRRSLGGGADAAAGGDGRAPTQGAAPGVASSAGSSPGRSTSGGSEPAGGGTGGGLEGARGGSWGGGGRGGGGRGASAVWVLRADGRLERIVVRVGITDGLVTEIVSGDLNEGDKVVTEMTNATASAANRTTARPGGMGRMF